MATKQVEKKGFELKPYVFLLGIILLMLSAGILYRLHISHKRLIPISILALMAGLFFESKRFTDSWKPIGLKALGAFVFSFLAFFPGKREHNYDFENHIQIWPYYFILIFILICIIVHGDKVIPKLTEGITLLQSIAVIYWVLDYGFMTIDNWFLKVVLLIGLLYSLYSLFHAFTHSELSRKSRLRLSIWSSIIMLLFAVDNIYRVYQNEQIENAEDIPYKAYIVLQYFLLGISSIYIVQNFLMISGFLPGKGTFFNKEYYRDIKRLKDDHVKRYSDKQVSILYSFFCVLFTGTIFVLNSYFQILPRNMAIWIVFVFFPYVLIVYDYATRSKSNT